MYIQVESNTVYSLFHEKLAKTSLLFKTGGEK